MLQIIILTAQSRKLKFFTALSIHLHSYASFRYTYKAEGCDMDITAPPVINLCDARTSVATVIAYFEQIDDFTHMEELWQVVGTLEYLAKVGEKSQDYDGAP